MNTKNYRIDWHWFGGFGFGIWFNNLWGDNKPSLWTVSIGPFTIHWVKINRKEN